jgi:hypothetical protein
VAGNIALVLVLFVIAFWLLAIWYHHGIGPGA